MSVVELLRCCRRRGTPGPTPRDPLSCAADEWHTAPGFTYVGAGGRFVQETNYKYVGDGAGEYRVEPYASGNGCRMCLGGFIAAMAGLAAAMLWIIIRYGGRGVASGMAPVTRVDPEPEHDCSAGFSNWQKGWSPGKQAWCCTYYKRGCVAMTTTQVPYDCLDGLERWAQSWSVNKKSWCCLRQQVGCESTPRPVALSTHAPYRCDAGLHARANGWSAEQKVWCCLHERKGCPTAPPRPAATRPPLPATTFAPPAGCDAMCEVNGLREKCGKRMVFSATHTFAGQPGACAMAIARVSRECSQCSSCTPDGAFCASLTVTQNPAPAVRRPPGAARAPPPPTPKTTYSLPYDCIAGFSNWKKGWSDAKKAYCCQRSRRGCESTTAAPATTPRRPATTPPPATTAPPATTPLVGSSPYDCAAGLPNWKRGWSVKKKAWCCEHERRGCPDIKPGPERDSPPYDCEAAYANWEMVWSIKKKAWCCQHKKRGCPPQMTSVPYSCNAGYSNWETGWSTAKKVWCCRNVGRGCAKTTSAPYDCVAGYSNWEKGWSVGKKKFCCTRVDCSTA